MPVFTACVAEDFPLECDPGKSPEYTGEKVTQYFSFRLDMPDGVPTRASVDYGQDGKYSQEFNDGKTDENAVSNILIVFYDEDGKYVTHFASDSMTSVKDTTNVVIEKIEWKTTINVEVETYESIKDKSVSKYFAVANYTDDFLDLLTKPSSPGNSVRSLNDLLSTDISTMSYSTEIGKNTRFIMTSPGYYDKDNNYIYHGEKEANIGTGLLYNTRAEAQANPVTVYVERLAARVDLESIGTVDDIEVLWGTGVYGLRFKPTGWGLQALEKKEFLVKHNQSKKNDYSPSYYHSDFYDWLNFTDAPRSFWAESYSFISDDLVASLSKLNKYPATGLETDLTLSYNRYRDINLNETEFVNRKYQGTTYTLEHTFAGRELNVYNLDNPYAVPTSFVLAGKYTEAIYKGTDERPGTSIEHPDEGVINGNPVQSPVTYLPFNGSGFYLRSIDMERTDNDAKDKDEDGVPDRERYQYRLYRENSGSSDQSQKDELYVAMLREQHLIFVKQDDKYVPVKTDLTYGNGANLALAVFSITNTNKRYNGQDWVKSTNSYTLQLKTTLPSGIPTIYYGKYTGNKDNPADYEPITSTNITAVNLELQKHLGYAQRYFEGKAFLYAPITHYTGDYNPFRGVTYSGLFNYQTETVEGKTTMKKNPETGKYLTDHLTGDFGVVRNHIYNIKIDRISSLGYGISGDDAIVLPEPRFEEDIYQFDIQLRILPWNVFEYYLDI